MAFVTTFRNKDGSFSKAYNVDFSVGAAAANHPIDVMLVQALLRIVCYELQGTDKLTPPPGEVGIAVDGQFGPRTLKHILRQQQQMKAAGIATLVDGVHDPFRAQQQKSTIAKVRYGLEVLNDTCFVLCRRQGLESYDSLPRRSDVPEALRVALSLPERAIARKYQR